MIRLITVLASLTLAACSPALDSNANTFTLSSGVLVTSDGSLQATSTETHTKFEADSKFVTVKMREYFHSRGEIKHAWLSLPRNGIATLHIGTGATGGAKEESLRETTVRIARDRLPAGTTLSVYNLDTSETVAIHTSR
ncbi:MAG: hypothetical protein KF892_23815 [Rhizobacter sp.]|nr:hypothetical protein [Rhizobacter sp.]